MLPQRWRQQQRQDPPPRLTGGGDFAGRAAHGLVRGRLRSPGARGHPAGAARRRGPFKAGSGGGGGVPVPRACAGP